MGFACILLRTLYIKAATAGASAPDVDNVRKILLQLSVSFCTRAPGRARVHSALQAGSSLGIRCIRCCTHAFRICTSRRSFRKPAIRFDTDAFRLCTHAIGLKAGILGLQACNPFCTHATPMCTHAIRFAKRAIRAACGYLDFASRQVRCADVQSVVLPCTTVCTRASWGCRISRSCASLHGPTSSVLWS